MKKRVVLQEFFDEEIFKEQANAIELRHVPPPYLAGGREEDRARADGVAVRVEPEPPFAARHQDDVEEPKGVRLAEDEAGQLVHPGDVDQQVPPVLAPVERHSADTGPRRSRRPSCTGFCHSSKSTMIRPLHPSRNLAVIRRIDGSAVSVADHRRDPPSRYELLERNDLSLWMRSPVFMNMSSVGLAPSRWLRA